MADKNIKIKLDYSEFSGGIKECQSKMSLLNEQFKLQQAELGNSASQVDKLTLSQSALTQKIQLQEQIVEQAAAKLATLATNEGATQQQVDAAQRAFLKQQTTLEDLKNQLESTEQELQNISQSEQEVSTGADQASGSFQNLITALNGISAVSSAISSVASAVGDMARESASAADDINTMATQYGVATQTMDQWVAVSEQVDVSAETLGSSMSRLTRAMGSAESGSASAQAKFEQLGVKITDSSGHLKNAETVFYEVIDALGQIDNPAERDAAAMELLGKSAQQLNPIIQMGSSAFRELASSSQGIIPDGLEGRLNDLSDSFSQFDNALDYGQNLLVGAFSPAIKAVLDGVSSLDPSILALMSGVRLLFQVFSSLTPVLTMINSLMTAKATTTMAAAAGQTTHTSAVMAGTGAETGFAGSVAATNVALAPQLAIILAISAALALLAAAIWLIVDAFTSEEEAANGATDAMDRLNNATEKATSAGNASVTNATAHYATGSTVGGAGGLAWVGEQGPELVNLPMGSTVYNNEQSTSMTRSTNVFNVTIDAKNVTDFNRVVSIFSGLNQSMNRGGLVNG